ncbi:hypothetical protein LMG27198_16070 [Methylocystis echinoides]|uniref:Uncharacterized protein n=1 Tax=Methylocystis echinoides TaxID=29468 RepID=A0A9W6LRH2_9HYPH|nr:hypothetical protein LMG27198_16070 [Methylocystis echinoides]
MDTEIEPISMVAASAAVRNLRVCCIAASPDPCLTEPLGHTSNANPVSMFHRALDARAIASPSPRRVAKEQRASRLRCHVSDRLCG